MRRALILLLLPMAEALADPAEAAPPPPPERVAVEVADPALRDEINACIRKGVVWLRERQRPDGSFPGLGDNNRTYAPGKVDPAVYELTALALLALLKCDVTPKDPAIGKGFDYLKANAPLTGAYGYATALMAIEAKYASKEAIASGEGGRLESRPKPVKPSRADKAWAVELTNQILLLQAANGGWRYSYAPPDMEGGKPGTADVSATQYALMGLKTARRMGIPVKPEVFYQAADYLLAQQDPDGPRVSRITRDDAPASAEEVAGYGDRCRGWAYMRGNRDPFHAQACGSMTCAGLVAMLICRSECLEDRQTRAPERARRLSQMEQSIWDGLAWLSNHWSMENAGKPPGDGHYEQGYYLYALERVGVMADLRFIGPGHDWYLEGARVWTSKMTHEEDEKGFWGFSRARPQAETQDTPYGLLFLRQASLKLGYAIGGAEE